MTPILNSTLPSAFRSFALASVAALALAPTLAAAQDEPLTAQEAAEEEDDEIVVTGTLLQGNTPVGSNSITVGQEQLEETGATSSNELLASIPQVTNYFNRVPITDLAIAVNQIQISRPNLRNISGSNAASAATLILVDGHRVATAGVNQASVDPDLIPTGAIQRVEVVTEGGSSIYGADAVAGVINFITLKRFDGVKVGGSVGFADDYWQVDANATAGRDWGAGSAYVSYTFTKNDELYGIDRDFIRNLDYSALPYRGLDTRCPTPNVVVSTDVFGNVISTVPVTNNRCDNTDFNTAIPRVERHGVIAGLHQEFGDRTTLDVRANFAQRDTQQTSDLTGTVTVSNANPYVAGNLPAGLALGPTFVTIPGFGTLPATARAAVAFNLRPLLGLDSQRSETRIRQWGANAELRHDLTEAWELRGLLNYGESDSRYSLTGLNQIRLNNAGIATTAATAFNPFNVVNNNAALIADLMDEEIAGQAKDRLLNARLIAAGELFELPGGALQLAFGYEYMNDRLQQRFLPTGRIGALDAAPFTTYKRDVHSGFGELQLPLIADSSGESMLTISGQGRYDHYSDFGDTFNPKVGVTFRPIPEVTLRGNWGTSFTAPTPLDQLGSQRNSISQFGFVAFQPPGTTPPAGSGSTIAIQGSVPNLQPQEAETWSVGADFEPFDGLRASVNYYDVKFENILGTPTPGPGIFAAFPNNVLYSPTGLTVAQINAFFDQPNLTPALQTQLNAALAAAAGTQIRELVDFRTGNFGILDVTGIDFSINYQLPTGFGSLDFGVFGNRQLSRKVQASPTSAVLDELALNTSKFTMQAQAGATVGTARAVATLNHNSGYDITPTSGVPPQSRVGSFNTLDLFFKFDAEGPGIWGDGLTFTVNVKNVFDQDPPEFRSNGFTNVGYANGFSIGRMFILGLSKTFR